MTDRQTLLVKTSWNSVLGNAEEAGMLFYSRLFEVAPELKPLFKTDTRQQARKLTNMVSLIVSKLHHLDEIAIEVKILAQRHGQYGVKPTHYSTVGDCLLWTLEQALGSRWNDETKIAWTTVYVLLANTMITHQAGVQV